MSNKPILEETKAIPVTEIAAGILLIFDIMERIERRTGHVITVENLAQFAETRKAYRMHLNKLLGIPEEPSVE